MRRRGLTVPNYRGAPLPRPMGIIVPAVAIVALGPLALLEDLSGTRVLAPETAHASVFVAGVALLGLIDDLLGGGADAPRGIRAHLAELARGRPSTGVVKAAGNAALALYVLSSARLGAG